MFKRMGHLNQMHFPMMFGRMHGMKHRVRHRPHGRRNHHMMHLLNKMGPRMMHKMRSHMHKPHGLHRHMMKKHHLCHPGMHHMMSGMRQHKAHGARPAFGMGHHEMGPYKMHHRMTRRGPSLFMGCECCV